MSEEPRLAERLAHADAAVRRRAALTFKRLGTAAAPFAGELVGALHSDDAVVRRRAAEALGTTGAVAAAPFLQRLRFDDDRRLANAATRALSSLGTPALQSAD